MTRLREHWRRSGWLLVSAMLVGSFEPSICQADQIVAAPDMASVVPPSRGEHILQELTPERIQVLKARTDEAIDQLNAKLNQIKVPTNSAQATEAIKSKATTKAAIDDLKETKAYLSGAEVSESQLTVIKEVVVWLSRPVWVICGGSPWLSDSVKNEFADVLAPSKMTFAAIANGIGLLSIYDTSTGKLIGDIASAVGIGSRRIMTNAHVITDAQLGYKDSLDGKWKLSSGTTIKVEFPYEYERCAAPARRPIATVKAVSIRYVDELMDIAILETDGDVFKVSFDVPPDVIAGDRIGVIGYPTRPPDSGTFLNAKQIDQVFRAPDGRTPFPAERISSGKANRSDDMPAGFFRYDATTWEGNSGSVVISLVNGPLLGYTHVAFRRPRRVKDITKESLPQRYKKCSCRMAFNSPERRLLRVLSFFQRASRQP